MSMQSAQTFFNRLSSDSLLNAQIRGMGSREERMIFARSAGYDFSPKDWDNVLVCNGEKKKDNWHSVAGRSGCTFPNECK